LISGDSQLRAWVSDAEVAEVPYTAFASKKGRAVTARLIIRRVRDLAKLAPAGQDELFTVWRYHAIVEQVFADGTTGRSRTCHMSGSFAADAAWLACAAIACKLLRAGRTPGHGRVDTEDQHGSFGLAAVRTQQSSAPASPARGHRAKSVRRNGLGTVRP
jgi:hypothetical protein